MKRIAIIGSMNVDHVSYVDKFPSSGETVLATKYKIAPGGKGANQAYVLGVTGAEVAMFGAVGCDSDAEVVLKSLESADVDVKHVLHTDAPTGRAAIMVDKTGDNCIVVAQGANLEVTSEYIDEVLPALEGYDIIVMQLEIPIVTVTYAANKLKQMGKTIILDPAPMSGLLTVDLLRNVDFIKPNEIELFELTGTNDIEEACNILLSNGVGCVLASLGAKGVAVKQRGVDLQCFGVEAVPVVDTTAAGDSFIAAFTYAVANGFSVECAAQFAGSVATIVVQREGAQESIPTREEIQTLYHQF
jgi:ribokinase